MIYGQKGPEKHSLQFGPRAGPSGGGYFRPKTLNFTARAIIVRSRAKATGAIDEFSPCVNTCSKGRSDMKTVFCSLAMLAVCFVTVGTTSAQDAAAKQKEARKKQNEMAEKSFKTLDKDQDGQLTFDEYKQNRKKAEQLAKAEEIFKLIDTDHDKKLSLKEFQNKSPEARFKQMDANDDGKLDFTEFKGNRKKADQIELAESNFKRIDADGNKEVTLEEFKAAQKKPAGKPAGKKQAKE
jgi:Ca2+-binding EF-hand superfamily protein